VDAPLIAIRSYRPDDLEPVNRMLLDAFPDSAPYGPRLREFHDSGIGVTLVADDGRALVGMGTLLDYGTSGYVAHVGVAPAAQSRGLGRRLMVGLLSASRERGHRFVELQSTDAGFPLYVSLGFVLRGETYAYTGGHASGDGDDGVVASASDRAEIAAFDALAFGADRSTTVAQWFADPTATLVVHREGGRVSAVAAARRGRIGPWLATNDRSAGLVLDALLARQPQTLPVYAPSEPSRRLLTERGFTAGRRSRHMVYGSQDLSARPYVYGLVTLSQG